MEPFRDRKPRGTALWSVLGAMVLCFGFLFVVDRHAFVASLHAARRLRWGWLVLAALAELASLVAASEGHRRLLRAAGGRIRLRSVVGIAFASTAIAFSVPVAPLPFSASYSFRQYALRGIDLALAGWALVILWMSATLALSLVLFAGVASSGNLLVAAGGLLASLVFLVPPVALLLALRFPGVRRWMTGWVDRVVSRLRRSGGHRLERLTDAWPDPAAALDTLVARAGSLRVPVSTYVQVFVLSLSNWLLDVVCLVVVIRATGPAVPWHGLLLAYGAGIVAGSIWPTPGGLGAVEAAMAASLVGAGMPAGAAVTVVVVYRLVSFWMLLGIGWVVMAVFSRRRERTPLLVAP